MSHEFFKSDHPVKSSRFVIEEFEHNMWSEYGVEKLLFVAVHDEIGIEIVCSTSGQATTLGNKILQYRHFDDLDSIEKSHFELTYSGRANWLRLEGNLYNAFESLKSNCFINSGFARTILHDPKIQNLLDNTREFEFPRIFSDVTPTEVLLDVPIENANSNAKVTKITYLKGEEAVKFYFVDEKSYRHMIMRLDLLLHQAVDDPSEELHFMCKGKDDENSLLFLVDLFEALAVMESYGLISEETRLKILSIVSVREYHNALLDNEFKSSKVYLEMFGSKRVVERTINVPVGRPTWKINKITYRCGEEEIKVYMHDQIDYDWMLIQLGWIFDNMREEYLGPPANYFNYQRGDVERSVLFINNLLASVDWLLDERLITPAVRWKILEVFSVRELNNALLDQKFERSRVLISNIGRLAEIEEDVKRMRKYVVKPVSLASVSYFSLEGELVLFLNNNDETEEFFKIFSALRRGANCEVKQHFKITFVSGEAKVTLRGNLFQAYELLAWYQLITQETLAKYIDRTPIAEFIRKTKFIGMPEELLLHRRKFGMSPK